MNLLRRFFKRGLTCEQVEKVLQRYLDNELEPDQVPKVLAHLEACKDCGLEAEMYRRIKDSLRAHQQEANADSLARLRSLAEELATSGAPDTDAS